MPLNKEAIKKVIDKFSLKRQKNTTHDFKV